MDDNTLNNLDDIENAETAGSPDDPHANFSCPNCGNNTRDDVMFLCNTCDSSELMHKDGMYICPSCMEPGENFECLLCGSKEVKMSGVEEA